MSELSNSRYPHARATQGFTLIEVLVAFAILVVSLAVLMRVFSGGFDSLESARQHSTAALVARSVLERIAVEIPLAEGDVSGDAGGGFMWHAELRQSDALESVAAGGAVRYQPYTVTIAVARDERPLLSLHSLRFAVLSDGADEAPVLDAEPAR